MFTAKIIKKLHSLRSDCRGAVAIMFVAFLNVMIAMLALTLDIGRGYLASSEIQNAATAASISSAMLNGDVAAARKYFVSNLPSGLHSITYDFDANVRVVVNGGSVSVIPAGFDIPAFFPLGDLAGNSSSAGLIKVGGISTVGLGGGKVKPADYFFVLDTSGSMGYHDSFVDYGFDSICPSNNQRCRRIESVREATNRVIDTIAKSPDSKENYGVSIIGWSSDRSTNRLDTGFYNPIRASEPLSADFSKANNAVQSLKADGGTCGACGLHEVQKYTPLSKSGRTKVIIFMTDGSMNVMPTSYKTAAFEPFSAVREKCDEIKKDKEVTFWSITFGSDVFGDPRNADLRNYCASAPEQSVHVANGKELDKLFGEIFEKTGRLKVTR